MSFSSAEHVAAPPLIGEAREGLRVLLLAHDRIAPGPTGSGNRAIRWGLLDGLARAGAVTAFYSASPAGKSVEEFVSARTGLGLEGRFWFDQPSLARGTAAVKALSAAVNAFRPDVVLAYGIEPLRLARAAAPALAVGIMSVDLEHLPVLHRHVYNLRYGRAKQKIKSLLLTPRELRFAWRVKRDIERDYPLADFVINHAAHHARWHGRKHGRPVLYAPNPVSALAQPPVRNPVSPPRFTLLGGIGGIATLTGLAWFAREVYPRLEPAIVAGEFEVHLVGRGELEPSIDRRMPRIVRRGYVDDLALEFAATTALLVPTPIDVGFRTRIVDAFRHGVTAVAHPANGLGMPELQHGMNALVSADPGEFAGLVLRLARDPGEAARLGKAAFADFGARLNNVAVAARILAFIEPHLAASGVSGSRR